MQTAEDRHGHYFTVFRWVYSSRYWTVFVQADVRSSSVVIAIEVLPKNPMKMSLVQNDAVVQTLSAKTADRSLGVRILPWAFPSSNNLLRAHRFDSIPEF